MTDFNQKTHDTDVGSHGGQSRQMMEVFENQELTCWSNCPASSMSARIIFWWAVNQVKRKSKMICWALFRSCLRLRRKSKKHFVDLQASNASLGNRRGIFQLNQTIRSIHRSRSLRSPSFSSLAFSLYKEKFPFSIPKTHSCHDEQRAACQYGKEKQTAHRRFLSSKKPET